MFPLSLTMIFKLLDLECITDWLKEAEIEPEKDVVDVPTVTLSARQRFTSRRRSFLDQIRRPDQASAVVSKQKHRKFPRFGGLT